MITTIVALRTRLTTSKLAQRLVGAATWSIVGAVVSSILNLLAMMFVARVLGKESFGQLIVVQSTLAMVGVFAGFGVGSTATRYIAELRSRDREKLTRILVLTERTVLIFGVFAALGLALMSRTLATDVLNSPGLTLPLSIAAMSVFFSALDGYQKCTLVGLEAMRPLAIGTVIGAATSVPVILLSAHLFGLPGAAGGITASALIQSGISRFQMLEQLRRFAIPRIARGCSREWRALRDFALPSLLAGALVMPAHWACHAMLANRSGGYAELAVLGIAMQWFNVVLFFPNAAGRVVLPILTDHIATRNHVDAKRLLMFAIGANALLAVPVSILLVLSSTWILSIYGPEFRNGVITMIIAVVTAALLAVQAPVGNMIAASSRMWLGALMNLGWALVYVSVAYTLVIYGAAGVAGAMGIAYLMHFVWTFTFAFGQIRSSKERDAGRNIVH